MIHPLNAATDGLLNPYVEKTLMTGVRGLLIGTEFGVPPVDPTSPQRPSGGGGGAAAGKGRSYKAWKQNKTQDIKFEMLKLEDEEIMIIIKTFMKCQ